MYYRKSNLKILSAELMHAPDVLHLPEHLRKYRHWWWTRTPGPLLNVCCAVKQDGDISKYKETHISGIYVRPVLILENAKAAGFKIGDRFHFGHKRFELIFHNVAFCVSDIGCHSFRADAQAADANIYEASDVKQIIDEWFEKAKADITPFTLDS